MADGALIEHCPCHFVRYDKLQSRQPARWMAATHGQFRATSTAAHEQFRCLCYTACSARPKTCGFSRARLWRTSCCIHPIAKCSDNACGPLLPRGPGAVRELSARLALDQAELRSGQCLAWHQTALHARRCWRGQALRTFKALYAGCTLYRGSSHGRYAELHGRSAAVNARTPRRGACSNAHAACPTTQSARTAH